MHHQWKFIHTSLIYCKHNWLKCMLEMNWNGEHKLNSKISSESIRTRCSWNEPLALLQRWGWMHGIWKILFIPCSLETHIHTQRRTQICVSLRISLSRRHSHIKLVRLVHIFIFYALIPLSPPNNSAIQLTFSPLFNAPFMLWHIPKISSGGK